MSCICHCSYMTADPISVVQAAEGSDTLLKTAAKDMLTLNSADETDKTYNTTGSKERN